MLEFSLQHRAALDAMTSHKEMKLRKYEMDEDEWEIARQLCEVLKVSSSLMICLPFYSSQLLPDLQGRNLILLA